MRERLGLVANKQTNAYRLIHAEGDGLPGLIVDIYGSVAVIQTHTLGMYKLIPSIADALQYVFNGGLTCIYDKSADALGKQSISSSGNSFVFGQQSDAVINENGVSLYVNWVDGQKQVFLDQRENRELFEKYPRKTSTEYIFLFRWIFSNAVCRRKMLRLCIWLTVLKSRRMG